MPTDLDAPIGVFDSGLGGLTVVRALRTQLPGESLIYVGDTARVPYGPKSPDVVRQFALQIAEWLLTQRVKAVVVACNTATAHALDALQAELPVPVIGVIEPGARAAVAASRRGVIGVIGTAGTIASGAYARAILALAPGATVHAAACALFVPLVEEGWTNHAATRLIVDDYLSPLADASIDTLVLGCTHYPLLADLIAARMGPSVALIDSASETARDVHRELRRRQLLRLDVPRLDVRGSDLAAAQPVASRLRVVASDAPERFLTLGRRFLGDALTHVEHVTFA